MQVQYVTRSSSKNSSLVVMQEGLPPLAKVSKLADNDDGSPPTPKPNVELLDKALWDAFYEAKNEMIVTKPGRRMFPTVSFAISNLEETCKYSISLRFVLADEWRYKFVEGRWKTNGMSDVLHDETRMVIEHHCSPALGGILMKKPISFKTLKITHHSESAKGNILLHTMHRYMTELLITKVAEDSSSFVFPFPETTFTAVTSYQSSEVTQLKVSNNPFAKGFKDREMYSNATLGASSFSSLIHPYSSYTSSLLLPPTHDWARFPPPHYPHLMCTPPVTPPFATVPHHPIILPPPTYSQPLQYNPMLTPIGSPANKTES